MCRPKQDFQLDLSNRRSNFKLKLYHMYNQSTASGVKNIIICTSLCYFYEFFLFSSRDHYHNDNLAHEVHTTYLKNSWLQYLYLHLTWWYVASLPVPY